MASDLVNITYGCNLKQFQEFEDWWRWQERVILTAFSLPPDFFKPKPTPPPESHFLFKTCLVATPRKNVILDSLVDDSRGSACECGAEKTHGARKGSPLHSSWCPNRA